MPTSANRKFVGGLLYIALATLVRVAWPATDAFAQPTKSVRGTVTSVTADSINVRVQNVDMKFMVDAKTTVEARGAGTKGRAAERAGVAGPRLSEVMTVGEAVEVTYHDTGGALHAEKIRAVIGPGTAVKAEAARKSSSGTIKSISPTSVTISGSSGAGATFDQTFAIDSKTKVVGRGVGAKSAAKGGKVSLTDLVSTGDKVTVSFHDMGGTLLAAEVRVMSKGSSPSPGTSPPPLPPPPPPPPPKTSPPPVEPALVQFPWPPPQWTTRQLIPLQLGSTLGAVFDELTAALRRGEITDWSVYGIGNDGFAIAARRETIRDDGLPVPPPNRWSAEPPHTTTLDFAEIVRRAFNASPGRYRIIVLAFTPRSITAGASQPEVVKRLPEGGAGQLPAAMRSIPVPPERGVEALIYEFFRASPVDSIHMVSTGDSHLTAKQHLVGAGLWRETDLR